MKMTVGGQYQSLGRNAKIRSEKKFRISGMAFSDFQNSLRTLKVLKIESAHMLMSKKSSLFLAFASQDHSSALIY